MNLIDLATRIVVNLLPVVLFLVTAISFFTLLTNRFYTHVGSLSGFGWSAVEDLYPSSVGELLRRPEFPEQMVNLADDPEYAAIKQDLAGRLMEQLRMTGDPRVTGHPEVLEGNPYYGQCPRHPSWQPETGGSQ